MSIQKVKELFMVKGQFFSGKAIIFQNNSKRDNKRRHLLCG
jgi:hypothetical protein